MQEREQKYDLYETWNVIFYIVKTGCQCRILPSYFTLRKLVCCDYCKWSSLDDVDLLVSYLQEKEYVGIRQKVEDSIDIIDDQNVRRDDNRLLKSIDISKTVKGIKGHLVVVPVMIMITWMYDSSVVYLLTRNLRDFCCNIKIILTDVGYRGKITERIKNVYGYIHKIIVSGNKINDINIIGKRWVIGRIFSRYENCRKKERNESYSIAFPYFILVD